MTPKLLVSKTPKPQHDTMDDRTTIRNKKVWMSQMFDTDHSRRDVSRLLSILTTNHIPENLNEISWDEDQ